MSELTWVVLIIAIFLSAIYISLYSDLKKTKKYTSEAWSELLNQLSQRNELIPDFIKIVMKNTQKDKQIYLKINALREQLITTPKANHEQILKVSNQLSSTLKVIFDLVKDDSTLKKQPTFSKLRKEAIMTENRIFYSRQLYNSSAALFDEKLSSFPTNLIAKIHRFKQVDYLENSEVEIASPLKF